MGYYRIITYRPDTSSNWSSKNPVLQEGEGAFETDTGYIKVGDGSSNYNDLPYITPLVHTYDLTSANATHTFPKVTMKGQVCDVFWTNGGTYKLSFAVSNSETIGGETASTWEGEGEGHIRVISDGSNWQVVDYDDFITNGDAPGDTYAQKMINGELIINGWLALVGDGTTTTPTVTVTFVRPFANTNYDVALGTLGYKTTSSPTSRTDRSGNAGEHLFVGGTPTASTLPLRATNFAGNTISTSTYIMGSFILKGTWK